MRRFFISSQQVNDNVVIITGADVNHIGNVLRLRAGDELILSDGMNFEYQVEISEIHSSKIRATILKKERIDLLSPQVTLVQAIPKGAKMDTIVRQATELGVSSVIPVITSRTVVRLSREKKEKKRERWQNIAKEAAEQSQRSSLPAVSTVCGWDEALQKMASNDLAVAFWEEASELFSERVFIRFQEGKKPEKEELGNCCILIGPEGGFSSDEIRDLDSQGIHCFSLGKQILRTETASAVALGIFFYELTKLGR